MINKMILQGRLVADPELHTTQSGVQVCRFRVACDRSFKSKDPNAQSVDFFNVTAWRGTGETIAKYFTKGQMIIVSGRVEIGSYTNKDGANVPTFTLIAEEFSFCGRENSNGQGGQYNQNGQYSQNTQYPQNNGGYQNNQGGAYQQQPQQAQGKPPVNYGPPANFNPAPHGNFSELVGDDGDLPF